MTSKNCALVVMMACIAVLDGTLTANTDPDFRGIDVATVSTGGERIAQFEGTVEVPVVVSTTKPISGMQISMKYNTDSMIPGTPATTDRTEGMSVAYNVDNDHIVILMYDISGKTIEPGGGPVLTIPFTLSQENRSESELALQEVIHADEEAQAIPTEVRSAPVTIHRDLPTTYALAQNYPNPFNPETVIDFQLPEASHVTLAIYNVLGQEIRRLVDERKSGGYHNMVWDGTNELGKSVASGLYFYCLKTKDFKSIKKMMMLK